MENYTVEVILLFIISMIPFFFLLANNKYRREDRKEILDTVIPSDFILEDIIIIKQFGHNITPSDNDKIIRIGRNNDLRYKIIPLIRNTKTGELLMTVKEDFYGYYRYSYNYSVFTNRVDWKLQREDYSQINLGDTGKYYLKEYVHHDLRIEGNNIYFNDIKYRYMGNIADSKLLNEIGNCLLFNTNRNNNIQIARKVKFFRGCIEFNDINKPIL